MKNVLCVLALLGLSLAAFHRVGANEFLATLEESDRVLDTPASEGFEGEGLVWAWTTTRGGRYQPLAWTLHVVSFGVFGNDAGKHQWTVALLHGLAAALFFLAFAAWTRAPAPSFVGAALFAVHPLALEAVAMPSGRGLVLAGLFVALSLLWYTQHVRRRAERGGAARLYLSLLAFVAALLCHPAAAVFALVPLLLTPDPGEENENRPLPGERLVFLFVGFAGAGAAILLAPSSGLGVVERKLGA